MAKFYKEAIPPLTIVAVVDVEPRTLNSKSRGKWITVHIELPDDYSVSDIDISTVKLNGEFSAELHPTEDRISDLMVKFDRAKVMALLSVGEATLTITGEVNGIPFEGSDIIRVFG